jgi:hypothetical protein
MGLSPSRNVGGKEKLDGGGADFDEFGGGAAEYGELGLGFRVGARAGEAELK